MTEQDISKPPESGCCCPEERPMHIRIVQLDDVEKTIPLQIRIKRTAKDWDDENFKRWETVAFSESVKFITLFITLNIAIIGVLFGLVFPKISTLFSCYFEKIFLSVDIIFFLVSLLFCLLAIFNRYTLSETKVRSFHFREELRPDELGPYDEKCTLLSNQYSFLQKAFVVFFIFGVFCFLLFAFYFFLR